MDFYIFKTRENFSSSWKNPKKIVYSECNVTTSGCSDWLTVRYIMLVIMMATNAWWEVTQVLWAWTRNSIWVVLEWNFLCTVWETPLESMGLPVGRAGSRFVLVCRKLHHLAWKWSCQKYSSWCHARHNNHNMVLLCRYGVTLTRLGPAGGDPPLLQWSRVIGMWKSQAPLPDRWFFF